MQKLLLEVLARRRANSGFTLVELLVVIIIIGILASILIGSIGSGLLRSRDVSKSEEMAKAHLLKLYPKVKDLGAACTERDTDNDGYLSCDVSGVDGNERVQEALLCAAPWSLNSGCKRNVYALPGQRIPLNQR